MKDKVIVNMLIEGFDPSKLENKEQKKEEAWKKIIGAYQNRMYLEEKMVGIDVLQMPVKDEEGEEKLENITCAVIEVGEIRGFIPIQQFGVNRKREMRAFVGQKVAFTILNYDKDNDVFVGSRTEARKIMADNWLKQGVEEGMIIPAVVRYVTNNLIRADIGGIDVKIPISEVRYGWIDDLRSEYPVGTHMLVKVLKIDKSDKENIKVEVSAKQAQENPFPKAVEKYRRGSEVRGVVSGVEDYGVFVNLEDGVDSLARHLRFEPVEKGDEVLVRILGVDTEEEKIHSRIIRITERKKRK